jgi:tryptophan synthase alpha subunit
MTYSNLIYNMDMPVFNSFCTEQKIKGLILPDVPACEKGFIRGLGVDDKINIISFMTPESSDESIAENAKASDSFVYFISMRGITGGEFNPDEDTVSKISLARRELFCSCCPRFRYPQQKISGHCHEYRRWIHYGHSLYCITEQRRLQRF